MTYFDIFFGFLSLMLWLWILFRVVIKILGSGPFLQNYKQQYTLRMHDGGYSGTHEKYQKKNEDSLPEVPRH